jgi:hypothetical protein
MEAVPSSTRVSTESRIGQLDFNILAGAVDGRNFAS